MERSQNNQLLGFLRARARPPGQSFRTNPRQSCFAAARLGWHDGGKYRFAVARMIDMSRAGAAVLVVDPPPLSQLVRVRLAGRRSTPWIEADVVGIEPDSEGGHRVRLKFREPCPDFFLSAAVLGPLTDEEEASEAPRIEDQVR